MRACVRACVSRARVCMRVCVCVCECICVCVAEGGVGGEVGGGGSVVTLSLEQIERRVDTKATHTSVKPFSELGLQT